MIHPDDITTEHLPNRFAASSLDEYLPVTTSAEKALAAAHRMALAGRGNLVFAGPTGVGKTHLAAAVARAFEDLVREDHRARLADYRAALDVVDPPMRHTVRKPGPPYPPEWINVADAIVRIRLEFGLPAYDRDVTQRVIRLHGHPGLVVLDDLGREKTTDWTGEIVYALVNARYEAMLSTIVTTNLTSAELTESPYWPAISRLAEDGELVRIDAPDRRLTS